MVFGHDCVCTKQYSEKYDTYFCGECNKWLEEKCTDPDCQYCTTRPEKPGQVG
jgi:hypothetical protein